MRNFDVFCFWESRVSFEDFEVYIEGSAVSDVGCGVSVLGGEEFPKILQNIETLVNESQHLHMIIKEIN